MSVTFSPIPNAYVPDVGGLDKSTGGTTSGSFADLLSNAVHSVDQIHDAATSQVSNLLRGGGGDVSNVMVAMEKADVSFQLMMQVRNKIVSAYQDIEKMQF